MDAELGRKDLLRQVRLGLVDPDIAEELCLELGWGQLRPWPDPANFHPVAERYWTLGQCIAWLSWGSDGAILKLDPVYAHAHLIWRKLEPKITNLERLAGIKPSAGWELVPAVAPSVTFLLLQESRNRLPIPSLAPPAPSIGDALALLVGLLQAEHLRATATNWTTKSREILSPLDWRISALGAGRDGIGRYIDVLFRSDRQPAFYDIYVERTALQAAIMLAENESVSVAARGRNTPDRNAAELTTDQMRIWEVVLNLWPDGVPPMRVNLRDRAINTKLNPKVGERALRTFFNEILPKLPH